MYTLFVSTARDNQEPMLHWRYIIIEAASPIAEQLYERRTGHRLDQEVYPAYIALQHDDLEQLVAPFCNPPAIYNTNTGRYIMRPAPAYALSASTGEPYSTWSASDLNIFLHRPDVLLVNARQAVRMLSGRMMSLEITPQEEPAGAAGD